MGIHLTYHVDVPSGLFGPVQRQMERAARDAVKALLEDGQQHVRGRFGLVPPSAPGNPPAIDTGNLYRNVTTGYTRGKPTWGYLRAAVEYAIWLEFGTSKMAARPFMRPTALYLKQRAPEIVAEALRRNLGRGI